MMAKGKPHFARPSNMSENQVWDKRVNLPGVSNGEIYALAIDGVNVSIPSGPSVVMVLAGGECLPLPRSKGMASPFLQTRGFLVHLLEQKRYEHPGLFPVHLVGRSKKADVFGFFCFGSKKQEYC